MKNKYYLLVLFAMFLIIVSNINLVSAQSTLSPAINTFTVSPGSISAGKSVTFSWNSSQAESCSILRNETNSGLFLLSDVPVNGTYTLKNLSESGAFTLSCVGMDDGSGKDAQSTQKTVFVSVTPVAPKEMPVIVFSSYPSAIKAGQTSTLYWNTLNARRCILQYDSTEEIISLTGSKVIVPTKTTNYKIWCANDTGGGKDGPSAEKTTSVVVTNTQTVGKKINFTEGASDADIDMLPNNACSSLMNNLRYRSRDDQTNGEVSTLQDFLQTNGYLNSEPTGFFGLLTMAAVKNFQLTVLGLGYNSGFVGPLTRAKIKSLSCE